MLAVCIGYYICFSCLIFNCLLICIIYIYLPIGSITARTCHRKCHALQSFAPSRDSRMRVANGVQQKSMQNAVGSIFIFNWGLYFVAKNIIWVAIIRIRRVAHRTHRWSVLRASRSAQLARSSCVKLRKFARRQYIEYIYIYRKEIGID